MADSQLELILESRAKDLGGFSVRRVLPSAVRRMVGPFIFFDHMGPATLPPGSGIDVRPHPHIGLATVTYLFEGEILHRDSLGSEQIIQPGAVNWMTAGRGIVHSERTPQNDRVLGVKTHGIQCWVALPTEDEEIAPSFNHHPAGTLPEFKIGRTELKLLAGKAFGYQSPVITRSELFYLEATLPAAEKFNFKSEGQEAAVYVVSGRIKIDGQDISEGSMAIAKPGDDLSMEALDPSRLMILGGQPVGHRLIWWNLVASSQKKLDEARADWKQGPRDQSSRFKRIAADDQEFIPAPEV